MTNQDRFTTPGPARDDPELGGTTTTGSPLVAGTSGGPDEPGAADRAREAAATGRDQAQQVASTAADQARDVAATARDEAQHVARTAEGQARRLAYDARDELRAQASTQVERFADGLGDLSRQLRSMGERGDPGPAADFAGQAAVRTEQMADRLRAGGFDDAIGQLRSFGRNRPGLFLLGAFGVGLAAGRVVRNLSDDSPSGSGLAYGSASAGNGSAGNGSARRAPKLQAPTQALEGAPYGAPASTAGQPIPPAGGTAEPYGASTGDTEAIPPVPPAGPAVGGTYAERYEVPASAVGQPVPPARTLDDIEADAAAKRAYGAPDTSTGSSGSGGPVGEHRWGT
jgi:hypothetical protein